MSYFVKNSKPCKRCGKDFVPYCSGNLYCDENCRLEVDAELNRAVSQNYRVKNKGRWKRYMRNWSLMKRFGMTIEQHDEMLKSKMDDVQFVKRINSLEKELITFPLTMTIKLEKFAVFFVAFVILDWVISATTLRCLKPRQNI